MVKIAPIFRYGFTMWKKEDQQMVPTEFRLIKEMSRFIIRQITGKKNTLTEDFLGYLERKQAQSSEKYVMGLRVN
jgi:hypothetical protein